MFIYFTVPPERATLLLQGQTHARVTVSLAMCTGAAIHQVEISRAGLGFTITVLRQVTGTRGRTAKHSWTLQLKGNKQRIKQLKMMIVIL